MRNSKIGNWKLGLSPVGGWKDRQSKNSILPSRRFHTSGRVTGGLPSRRIANLREGNNENTEAQARGEIIRPTLE